MLGQLIKRVGYIAIQDHLKPLCAGLKSLAAMLGGAFDSGYWRL
jgi:hypothetical protein